MKTNYATIPDRIKAAIFDSVLLITVVYLITQFSSTSDGASTSIRVAIIMLLVVLYEPFFVSTFGGTIGHNKMNICVKSQKDENKNINFIQALIRFLVKVSLGWISLLTIGSGENRLAIHDSIVKSVVYIENK